MILNIAIAVMAVILGFSLSMFFLSRKGSEKKVIKNRMAYFAGVDVSLQNASRKHGHRRDGVKSLVERLRLFIQVVGAKISRFQKDNSLDMKMQQAAWPFLGSEFQVIMLGVGAVAALVLGLLTLDVLMAALGFIGGILGCMIALSIRIQRRQAAFVNQLGDMLSMVANALRAGFSFMQA
ncbi:MAG: secretion system protein F, partial [Anaerovibrio sp.]|nr:secretion system protein F [Anaerovibrio sp.]